MQKEKNEICLGLFFERAEENKMIYNQVPVITLIEEKKKLKYGIFKIGYFTLGDEGDWNYKIFLEIVVNWQNSQTKYLINITTILLYIIWAIFIGVFELSNE